MSKEAEKIDYHYGFYGVMRCKYECGFSREEVELQQEVELGDRPLRADAIFVSHLEVLPFTDALGGRLNKRNVIEYKSPGDSLSIDDFFKVVGYACVYKSDGKTVNEIPFEDVSVFIFCYAYPRKAFSILKEMGFSVSEAQPGIYCVEVASSLSVQAVIIPQLPEGYEELKILGPKAKKEDVLKVLEDVRKNNDPYYIEHIKAGLRISMAANPELYDEIREESTMVDVFERIFSKELKAKEIKGKREGKREGIVSTARKLLAMGVLTLKQIAQATGLPISELEAMKAQMHQGS